MNVVLLVLGTFMDMAPLIIICTPIFLPVATAFGVNPLQFGMILILNAGIGLDHAACRLGAVRRHCNRQDQHRARSMRTIWPFYLAGLAVLLLVTYLPGVVALVAEATAMSAPPRLAEILAHGTRDRRRHDRASGRRRAAGRRAARRRHSCPRSHVTLDGRADGDRSHRAAHARTSSSGPARSAARRGFSRRARRGCAVPRESRLHCRRCTQPRARLPASVAARRRDTVRSAARAAVRL